MRWFRALMVMAVVAVTPSAVLAASPPPNDDFAAPAPIAGLAGSVGGTTIDATTEGSASAPDVWYAWTAPETRRLLFVVDAGGPFVDLEVGDGASLGTFHDQSLAASCEFHGESPSDAVCGYIEAVAATEYRIRVASGAPGLPFTLSWRAVPANDDFDDATAISGMTGSISGSTVDAASEPFGSPRDVWYAWTAPSTVEMLFELHAPGAAIGEITVTGAATLATVAPEGLAVDCPASGADLSCVRVGVDASVAYRIRVVVEVDAGVPVFEGGGFVLSWQPFGLSPANDLFVDAEAIAGLSGSVAGTTVSAGSEGPEVAPRDVWYAWTAPETRPMIFLFQAADASFHGFFVGTGADASSFVPEGELADCLVYGLDGPNRICYRILATAGTQYRLQAIALISGPTFTSLGTTFSIAWLPPPLNDRLADATAISGSTGSVEGSTVDATGEPSDAHARDVWYVWKAPAAEAMIFDLHTPTATFTGFAVGHPPDIFGFVSDGTLVDCAAAGLDPSGRTCIRVEATAGVTYHVRVLVVRLDPAQFPAPGDSFTVSWRPETDPFTSLCGLTTAYSSKEGVAKALCAKLVAASEAEPPARHNILGAYIQQVEAQTGKAFDPAEAMTLVSLAESL